MIVIEIILPLKLFREVFKKNKMSEVCELHSASFSCVFVALLLI